MQPSTLTAWMCYGEIVEEGEISGLLWLTALAKYKFIQTQFSGSTFLQIKIQQTCAPEERAHQSLPSPPCGGMDRNG